MRKLEHPWKITNVSQCWNESTIAHYGLIFWFPAELMALDGQAHNQLIILSWVMLFSVQPHQILRRQNWRTVIFTCSLTSLHQHRSFCESVSHLLKWGNSLNVPLFLPELLMHHLLQHPETKYLQHDIFVALFLYLIIIQYTEKMKMPVYTLTRSSVLFCFSDLRKKKPKTYY